MFCVIDKINLKLFELIKLLVFSDVCYTPLYKVCRVVCSFHLSVCPFVCSYIHMFVRSSFHHVHGTKVKVFCVKVYKTLHYKNPLIDGMMLDSFTQCHPHPMA